MGVEDSSIQEINGQSYSSIRSELNKENLFNYLTQLNTFTPPFAISQFNLGQSNPTFLISDINNKKFVLRKKPAGVIIDKSAHAVEREFKILQALSTKTNIPVPKVYHLCQDPSIIGSNFYIMEFCKGRIYPNVTLESVQKKTDRKEIYFAMVDTLAQLHKIPVSILVSNPKDNFYHRQISALAKISIVQGNTTSENEKVGRIPRLKDMIEWFKKNAVQDEITIIHGDYKLDNVVIHPTENKVIAILDWELSTIGHPLSDVANMLLPHYMPVMGSDDTLSLKGRDLETLGIPSVDELLKRYCRASGRQYPVLKWDFCVAFSFFRLCVITQGIAARVLRKQASSQQALFYAKMFVPLAHLCLEIVDKNSSKL